MADGKITIERKGDKIIFDFAGFDGADLFGLLEYARLRVRVGIIEQWDKAAKEREVMVDSPGMPIARNPNVPK